MMKINQIKIWGQINKIREAISINVLITIAEKEGVQSIKISKYIKVSIYLNVSIGWFTSSVYIYIFFKSYLIPYLKIETYKKPLIKFESGRRLC